MRKRKLTLAVVVLAAAAAIAWYAPGPAGQDAAPHDVATVGSGVSPAVASMPAPAPTLMAAPSAPVAAARVPPAADVPLGSGETPDLRADAQGNLVTDAHARDELERLLALNGRSEAQDLLKRLEGPLPPMAYRQAVDAFYAYQNYAIAAAQLTAPSQPVVDEAGALQQLAALHALRVAHFGAAVAAAYFGEEEATAQRLLASMRANPDSGATLADRAAQAEASGVRP